MESQVAFVFVALVTLVAGLVISYLENVEYHHAFVLVALVTLVALVAGQITNPPPPPSYLKNVRSYVAFGIVALVTLVAVQVISQLENV